jgi:O-antigen/teichoic acid export membrane protein
MGSGLLWRRVATALGSYGSVFLGVLGTVAYARELGPHRSGLLGEVLVTTAFFQVLLDLTVEEAMVKFGFRYKESGRWGKLRRLYTQALTVKAVGGVLAGLAIVGFAPLADRVYGTSGLFVPTLIAALLPFAQSPEAVAGGALVIRERYDIRAAYLAVGSGLRLAGFAVGADYGVKEAVLGVVAAQAVSSALVGLAGLRGFREFPHAVAEKLGADLREIVRFVIQSSAATAIISARATLGTALFGVVSNPTQVSFLQRGMAPMSGLQALTTPVRLILLAEQTRDWERGDEEGVLKSLRRYSFGAGLLMLVTVPPLFVFMPDLVKLVFGNKFAPAGDPARILLIAGAIQLIFAWTKSFPLSIGRPGLRIVTHGFEALVFLPFVVALGIVWDANGAAAAVLISTCAFAMLWLVLLGRIARSSRLVVPGEPLST